MTASEFSHMSNDELNARCSVLLSTATREARELSAEEGQDFDAMATELQKRKFPSSGLQQSHNRLDAPKPAFERRPTGTFGYKHQGKWVRSVSGDESLAECTGEKPTWGPHFGELVAGAVTGDWNGRMPEKAAIQINQSANGGFLVPEETSRNLVDLARARMVTSRAGVQRIQLPAAESFSIGTLQTDATATWRREATVIPASNQTFGKITMYPKCLAALIPITREWLEDVQNGADLIEQATVSALATELDRAVIRGAGATEPTGIKNTTDVHVTSSVGAWGYDDLIDAMYSIWADNGPSDPSAVLLSPKSERTRRKAKDGDGIYLLQSSTPLAGVPFLVTSSIPDSLGAGAETEIYLGDFSRVLLGVRTNFVVEVLPAGEGSGFNATTQLGVWLRVYGRFDVHCEYPKHLAVLTGATNA